MDVIKLLDYLQEILDTSSKVPMTNKVIIDKDEITDVIDQIINYLPEEFRKAQWLCEEKERILKDAVEQAEVIKKESMDIVRKKIKNHDYVKEAHKKAEEIVSSAQKNARTLKCGARDYASEVLTSVDKDIETKKNIMIGNIKKEVQIFINSLESQLNETAATVKENVKELRNMK